MHSHRDAGNEQNEQVSNILGILPQLILIVNKSCNSTTQMVFYYIIFPTLFRKKPIFNLKIMATLL